MACVVSVFSVPLFAHPPLTSHFLTKPFLVSLIQNQSSVPIKKNQFEAKMIHWSVQVTILKTLVGSDNILRNMLMRFLPAFNICINHNEHRFDEIRWALDWYMFTFFSFSHNKFKDLKGSFNLKPDAQVNGYASNKWTNTN